MSNIEPNIIDPGKGRHTPPPPPDSLPGEEQPNDDHVGSDEIREPDGDDAPSIEPDPEERHPDRPDDIERA